MRDANGRWSTNFTYILFTKSQIHTHKYTMGRAGRMKKSRKTHWENWQLITHSNYYCMQVAQTRKCTSLVKCARPNGVLIKKLIWDEKERACVRVCSMSKRVSVWCESQEASNNVQTFSSQFIHNIQSKSNINIFVSFYFLLLLDIIVVDRCTLIHMCSLALSVFNLLNEILSWSLCGMCRPCENMLLSIVVRIQTQFCCFKRAAEKEKQWSKMKWGDREKGRKKRERMTQRDGESPLVTEKDGDRDRESQRENGKRDR